MSTNEDSTTNEDKFDSSKIDATKYISYIIPIVIFLGVMRLSIFYAYFGIKIVSFLDISEILTSFFDIIIVSILLGVYSGLMYMVKVAVVKINRRFAYVLGIIFFILYSIVFYLMTPENLTTKILLITAPFFGAGVSLYFMRKKHGLDYSVVKKDWVSLFVVVFFPAMLFVVWNDALQERRSIMEKKKYWGLKISYKDSSKTFMSDSNTYYIGKTNNYLFIYNEKMETTKVEKMDDVKSIEFPRSK